ncbi:MAG TPA: hydrogenase maturation peptidase HycI [Spirochaetia bacterium]|nr:hydrogenase maturation peptidase HycI [Spirochaetia bacterium]
MRNPQLAPALTRALEGSTAGRRVVILGVGSEIRADDAAGILVAERIRSLGLPGVTAIAGGAAPENFTGEIRQLSPSHLVVVDAADMGEKPGTIRLILPDEISGVSFSTHSLPLNVLTDYLQKEVGCSVLIMGIQPRSLELDGSVCAEVTQAIEEAVDALGRCLRQPGCP